MGNRKMTEGVGLLTITTYNISDNITDFILIIHELLTKGLYKGSVKEIIGLVVTRIYNNNSLTELTHMLIIPIFDSNYISHYFCLPFLNKLFLMAQISQSTKLSVAALRPKEPSLKAQ